MRIAALVEPGRFEIEETVAPVPTDDEVLVRVAACGVCGSDLDIWSGTVRLDAYPWHPGHEVSGTVELAGSAAADLGPGDPVATWVTARGFADLVAVRAGHCARANGVPLELALGEPLSCAVNAVDAANVAVGDDVVVVGAGFMGHLVHMLAHLRGAAQVIVADVRDDALERANSLGAAATVNVLRDDLAGVVLARTGGVGADVAFEVTGAQTALDALGPVTRTSGTIVIAGYHQGAPRSIPLGEWNWRAFHIVNGHVRDVPTILRGLRAGMRLVTTGRLSLEGLVTHRFPLEDVGEAFRAAREKPEGFVKATVTP